MSRRRLLIAGVIIVPPLVVVACLWLGFACGFLSTPVRYEIPVGYRGWLEVRAATPTCPPSRRAGVWRVVSINAQGRGCTSDLPDTGWQLVSHRYVYPDGRHQDLPHWDWNYTGVQVNWVANSPDNTVLVGFIGTVEELNQSWDTEPRIP